MLNELRNSEFLKTQINTYVIGLLVLTNGEKLRNFIEAVKHMYKIFRVLMSKMESSYTEVMLVHSTVDTVIKTLQKKGTKFPEDVLDTVDEIGDLCTDLADKFAEKKPKELQKYSQVDNRQPPDDFRGLAIVPNADDVKATDTPFLRKNRESGCYEDLEQYLDIHFRLLREDFVRPLREGITTYLKMLAEDDVKKKMTDIRIYNDVLILYPVCTPRGISYRIRFNINHFKRVRWQNSKRLIFGSLLCLSCDNFDTLLFATVMNRDIKMLEAGEIEVQFAENLPRDLPPNQIFVMAETTAYFEAYRHVLLGLTNIREDFPFQEYLVHGRKDVKNPKYVTRNRDTDFDMSCLCDDLKDETKNKRLSEAMSVIERLQIRAERKVKKVSLLDEKTWPTAERMKLDLSQYEALKTALTKELAIIQGPPGTGKTYIGLKIVNCLLENKEFWNGIGRNNTPILVVCYTNHALDQFLEGIIESCPDGLVRVGGRSKSEILKTISLNELRRKMRERRDVPQAIFGGRRDARLDMEMLERKMVQVSTRIAQTETAIIHEDVLQNVISYAHYESLTQNMWMPRDIPKELKSRFKRKSNIVDWLRLGDFSVENEVAQNVRQNQAGAVNIDVEGIEADLDQLELDLEQELDIAEEAELEELQRVLDLDDLNDRDRREAIHRMYRQNAREDVAFNLDDIDGDKDNQATGQWEQQKGARRQQKRRLKINLQSTDMMTRAEADHVRSIYTLPVPQRWRLYRYWVSLHKAQLRDGIQHLERDYKAAADRLVELMNQEDSHVMKTAKVIGMTTTGAAKYRDILQEIRPRIVIVEEAAEVLEAHIITTLSVACEHLILIGDHKQLRPNPTVYELAEKYKLKVSLFERLINNGIPHITLEKQHRMRPEISDYMHHIYPALKDDASVLHYDNIKGIGKDVFFLSHHFEEDHDEELKSKGNYHEAKFIAELCRYLLLQGYDQSQITILTPYTGQLVKLKKFMPKDPFQGVRITAIDNFQGEENDIILVSLVRSNKDNSIGFLKEDNRICVLLSRAKKGMYVVGNFDVFVGGNKLWNKVIESAKEAGCFGEELQLYCQNHPEDKGVMVKHHKDFTKVPEGGCMKPCDFRLSCGHQCARVCHTYDRDHKMYQCKKKCERKNCELGHKCPGICCAICKPCQKPVEKVIPKCQHIQSVPCSVEPERFICREKCSHLLPCGHSCKNLCGEAHTDQCREKVERILPCMHSVKMNCFENPTTYQCQVKCTALLSCEHPCTGTCSTCFQGRLHSTCTKKCGRILVCGHTCKANCTKECPPCTLPCANRCVHSKCPERCGQVCKECQEDCAWQCVHRKCTKKCHEPCNRRRCNQHCEKVLKCGHPCIGLCGEKCPSKCRICHKEEVTEILFGDEDEEDTRFVQLEDCGHIFSVDGIDRWMDEAKDGQTSIQLRYCPKCKTPILRNLRYGTIINQIWKDIAKVKRKVKGDSTKPHRNYSNHMLKSDAKRLRRYDEHVYDLLCNRLEDETMSDAQLNVIENTISFLKAVYRKKQELIDLCGIARLRDTSSASILELQMEKFINWLLKLRHRFSDQELEEAQLEMERIHLFFEYSVLEDRIKSKGAKLEPDLDTLLANAKQKFVRGQVWQNIQLVGQSNST